MPYAQPHYYLAFNGSLPSGEVWSFGLRTGDADPIQPDQAGMDAIALTAANTFRTKFQNEPLSQNGWANEVLFTGCTARWVGTDGKTILQGAKSPSVAVSTYSPIKLPPQIAVCVTLITPKSGKSGKGRVYLPLLALPPTSSGRVNSSNVGTIRTAFAAFLTELNVQLATATADASKPRVAVQSSVPGRGWALVTDIKVGDVFDTQRRRRDALVEAYTTGTI